MSLAFLPAQCHPASGGSPADAIVRKGWLRSFIERSLHGQQLLRSHRRSRARPCDARHPGAVRRFALDESHPGNGQAYIAQIAETTNPQWPDVLDGLEDLATQLGIPMPDDEGLSIPPLLELLAVHFGADEDEELGNLIERHSFEDTADLDALFLIATRFDDGHHLTAIQFEGCWYCSKPRLFEFGGNGCYLSREVRVISSSSQALQLGDQLRKAIVAADIEEASALIALETINLLAGVSDEPFRMNLRRRVAERLAQTPTISVT